MQRDKFDFRSSKANNEKISDSDDEFQLFKSLSLPELLSLLVEREPPFFYEYEQRTENKAEHSSSMPTNDETVTDSIDEKTLLELKGEDDNTTEKLQPKRKFGLYDSIPCHNLGEGSDNINYTEAQSFKLLEMLRWSIQPPHPVIIDESSTTKVSGMKLTQL